MAQYEWEATNRNGEYRAGTMEADDEAAVRNRLTGQGLIVTNVKKKAMELKREAISNPLSGNALLLCLIEKCCIGLLFQSRAEMVFSSPLNW